MHRTGRRAIREQMAAVRRGLRRRAVRLVGTGLDLLYPPRCTHCQADLSPRPEGPMLCADCQLELGPEQWPGCPRCGAGCHPGDDGLSPGCQLCRKTRLQFDGVIVLGGYEGTLRKAVLRMKRPASEPLSAAVGRLLASRRGGPLTEFAADWIVPVPMHWSRRLRRGVNSAEILADCLGRCLDVPVGRRILARRRATQPQADLSPSERFRNVRDAFRVRAGYPLQGIRVLLVDDILTTGATCSEAAGALKQAGAVAVFAAVAARAQGQEHAETTV